MMTYRILAAAAFSLMTALPAAAQVLSGAQTFTGTEGERWSHGLAVEGRKVASLAVTGATRRIRLEGGLAVRGENDETTQRAEETVCLDEGAFDSQGAPVPDHVCQNEHTIPAADLPAVVWPTATGTTFNFASGSEPDRVHWQIVTIDNNCRSTAGTGLTVTVTLDDGSTRAITYTVMEDDLLPCLGDSDTLTDYTQD